MPSRDQQLDADIERDVRKSYTTIATAEKNRRSPTGVLQRIGRLFTRWDRDFPRSSRRAANAVRVLCDVPLALNAGNLPLERSLREAIAAALREQAEAEYFSYEETEGKSPTPDELALHQKARAVISRAIRTDADETDISRVTNAIRKLNKEDGREENDDDGDQRKPYLAKEEA